MFSKPPFLKDIKCYPINLNRTWFPLSLQKGTTRISERQGWFAFKEENQDPPSKDPDRFVRKYRARCLCRYWFKTPMWKSHFHSSFTPLHGKNSQLTSHRVFSNCWNLPNFWKAVGYVEAGRNTLIAGQIFGAGCQDIPTWGQSGTGDWTSARWF